MNFELDGYMETLKDFPSSRVTLKTKAGTVKFAKLDVFKGVMFYFNPKDPTSDLLELTIEGVREIITDNQKGKTPESFDSFTVVKNIKEEDFEDAVGQDNISRFDNQKNKKKTRKKKRLQNSIKKRKLKK